MRILEMPTYLIIEPATDLSMYHVWRIRYRCVLERVGLLAILFL